jgi:UDP-N-acetylmuramoylalanine--D-glutamate ligase
VDDALASNPSASAASVEAFGGRSLTVIVGGADRGVDPEPLLAALAGHRPGVTVVVVPPDPERMAGLVSARLGPDGVVHIAGDLADAVAVAGRDTPAGGVVLFSPGAPTPEGGGGYGARSRTFADAAGIAIAPTAPV